MPNENTSCVWMQKGIIGIAFWIQAGSCICQELASSGSSDSTVHISFVHLGVFV